MGDPVILTAIDGRGTATLTLNRPAVFNGYNHEMIAALTDACARFAGDDKVRVVVLRGNGKHFSAGADINWFKELAVGDDEDRLAAARATTEAMRGLDALAKPVIVLIHGACIGGGTGYAASAAIVIASEDAKFAITEVRMGITPAPILPQLIAAIGLANVRRYALTAETFDVHEALRIGLVHQICPDGGLDAAAAGIIDALLLGEPGAVAGTKEIIADIGGARIDDALASRLAAISAEGRKSPEGVEGFDAFLAKRRPNWRPE